jgi:hypothetical protein
MAENSSEPGKESERRVDRDAPPEKTDTDNNKRQSGRAPARPPYEQYRRINNR